LRGSVYAPSSYDPGSPSLETSKDDSALQDSSTPTKDLKERRKSATLDAKARRGS
jgi:hypothetical protein